MSNYKGPLGIDPLQFSIGLFSLLVLFVVYLLAPRAVRKHYMGAYPKRHAWSARSRMRRSRGGYGHVRKTIVKVVACVRFDDFVKQISSPFTHHACLLSILTVPLHC